MAMASLRRRVGLGEGLEDHVALCPRHAGAGVLHPKAQAARLARDREQHTALIGELDGVGGEVEQDLPKPPLIGQDAAHAGRRGPGDLDALLPRPRRHQFAHRPEQGFHLDRRRVQLDARLPQLGEIQHVVDQAQEVLAAFAERVHIGALLGGQAGALEKPRHAQDAVQRRAELMAERGELVCGDLLRGLGGSI
jgi:hypothetical protein